MWVQASESTMGILHWDLYRIEIRARATGAPLVNQQPGRRVAIQAEVKTDPAAGGDGEETRALSVLLIGLFQMIGARGAKLDGEARCASVRELFRVNFNSNPRSRAHSR